MKNKCHSIIYPFQHLEDMKRKFKKVKVKKSESENSGIETTDMIKRLFDIMEAFGERMCIVENQI